MTGTWAVLASGESISRELVARVRHLPCIAVNDAYTLAPWAFALVGGDAAWWRAHPEAFAFAGDRWCASPYPGTQTLRALPPHTNSGLHALDRAIRYGARQVLLLGVDLCGKHFFGDHVAPLKNADAVRFELFRKQFAAYPVPKGVDVVNCSPSSSLHCFPKCTLDEALEMVAA